MEVYEQLHEIEKELTPEERESITILSVVYTMPGCMAKVRELMNKENMLGKRETMAKLQEVLLDRYGNQRQNKGQDKRRLRITSSQPRSTFEEYRAHFAFTVTNLEVDIFDSLKVGL